MNLKHFNSPSTLQKYASYLRSNQSSDSTIARKLSAINSFSDYLKQRQIIAKPTPSSPSIINDLPSDSLSSITPKFFNKYLVWATIILILLGSFYGIYTQVFNNAKKQLAYSSASSPTVGARILSFQGRLTDSSGNAITSSTGIIFKLFNSGTGGTELYTSSTGNSQTVVPDQNGIFNTVIGKSHGSSIPSSVFSENSEVWLEITTDAETMTPRQQIATVAYALNAETLQGMPPSASGLKNTVLVIGDSGNVYLGETSPSIISSSGTFGLEGQALLLKASDGSGGNITINPDGNGVIRFITEGTSPAIGGFIDASNANITSGNLFNSQINNANRGYNFLNFSNYDVGTTNVSSRFTVSAGGNLSAGGTINFTGINSGLGTTALFIDGSGTLSSRVLGTLAFADSAVGTTYTFTNGLTQSGSNVGLGGALTQNTRLNIGNTEAMFINFTNGFMGIGTTNPLAKLHVEGQCVTGDTLLKRRRRRKNKKGEWVDEYEDIRIDQIKVGDEILTLDEKTGKFIPSEVEGLMDMGIQQTYLLITSSGKQIRTTGNHPYLTQENTQTPFIIGGTYQIDQSPRIEDLTKNSFFAIANKHQQYIGRLSKEDKRKLQSSYKKYKRSKYFNAEVFAYSIATLINKAFINNAKIQIDNDYFGHESKITEIIQRYTDNIIVEFISIGHSQNSYAHFASYGAFIGKQKTDIEIKIDRDALKGVGQGVVTHQDKGLMTGNTRGQLKSAYQFTLDLSNKSSWKKVFDLKPGNQIATQDGWETIVVLKEFAREQTYDIQVANTHNFVGNNIVAHNTFLNGNVGIGTTAPNAKLEIESGYGISTGLKLGIGGSNVAALWGGNASSPAGILSLYGGSSENVRIRGDSISWLNGGNVGIGTTAPTQKLDVNGSVNIGGSMTIAGLTIGTTGTGTTAVFIDSTGKLYKNILGAGAFNNGVGTTYSASSGLTLLSNIFKLGGALTENMRLNIGNTEAMFINFTNGFMGVGTTNPLAKLHVEGQCVTGDTLLKRKKKKRKGHENDPDEYEDIRIDQIKVGDEILTLDETTGKFIPQKIEGLMDMGIQQTYAIFTESGKTIRTTNNHPYLVKPQDKKIISGTFEIDQSNRIEDLTKNSFIALANTKTNFVSIVPKTIKKEIIKRYTKNKLKLFAPSLFARSIVALINQNNIRHASLIIDKEYLGYEKLIKQIIVSNTKDILISFQSIGKNSPAHFAAYNQQKKVGASIKSRAATELLHSEFTEIHNSSDQLKQSYNSLPILSKSQWTKERDLKVGMQIATINGWEVIKNIYPVARELTYDIQVAHTHNFVGNNIVAHNTFLNGNVGIGTTNPLYKLNVGGTANFTNLFASGNVGIGTTSPGSKLSLFDTNKTRVSDTYNQTIITSDASGADLGGVLGLGGQYTGGSTIFGSIAGRKESNTSSDYAGYLSLNVRGSGSGQPTEAIRITSTGNVGIGTTNPGRNLVINSASDSFVSIRSGDSNVAGLLLGDQTSDFQGQIRYDNTANSLGLWTAGTEKLTILTGGNVGIGTTSPGSKLSLFDTNKTRVSDTYNQTIITSDASGADLGGVLGLGGQYTGGSTIFGSIAGRKESNTSSDYAGYLSLNVRGSGSGQPTEAIRITSTGNVGIGTTSPTQKLDVNGSVNIGGSMTVTGLGIDIGTTALFIDSNGLITKRALGDLAFSNNSSLGWVANVGTSNLSLGTGSSLSFVGVGISMSMVGNTITFTSNNIGTTYSFTNGLTQSGSNVVSLGGTLTSNTNLTIGNTSVLYINGTSGNIGIGLTGSMTPNAPFHVASIGTSGLSAQFNGFVAAQKFIDIDNYDNYYLDIAYAGDQSSSLSLSSLGSIKFNSKNNIGTTQWQYIENGSAIKIESIFDVTHSNSGLYIGVATLGTAGSDIGTSWNSGLFISGKSGATGNIGLGTTAPLYQLDLTGSLRVGGTFVSVGSTNTVNLLSADYLDGYNSSSFLYTAGTGISLSSTNVFSNIGVTSVLGTSNQVIVNNPTGAVTLSLPQDIHTGAQPTFARLGLGSTSSLYLLNVGGTASFANLFTSGNVGIGTTGPRQKLSIVKDLANIMAEIDWAFSTQSDDTVQLLMGTQAAGGFSAIQSFDPGTSWATKPLSLQPNGGNVGIGTTAPSNALNIEDGSGTTLTPALRLTKAVDGAGSATGILLGAASTKQSKGGIFYENQGLSNGRGNMYFAMNNTLNNSIDASISDARMTIQYNGRVGIGDTAPARLLDVKGNVCLDLNADDVCTDNTSALSDARLKTNVTNITNSLDLVKQLHGVRFNWNGEYNTGTAASLGFIAQEVETIFPELVITDTAGYKNLDYSKLTAVLAGAIQELNLKLDDLSLTPDGQVTVNYNVSPDVLASLGYSDTKNEIENAVYSAKINTGLIKTINLIAKNIVVENLFTQRSTIHDLKTAVITPLDQITDTIVIDGNLKAKEASFTTVYADQIINKEGNITDVMAQKIADLRTEITNLVTPAPPSTPTAIALASDTWDTSYSTASATLNVQNINISNDLIIGANLIVTGQATLSKAYVTGTLAVGQMALNDNNIETTASVLNIQPSGVGSVNILNSRLIVSDDGNIIINGKITGTEATFSRSLIANLLKTPTLDADVANIGKINIATDAANLIVAIGSSIPQATQSASITNNASAGTAILTSGTTELKIDNSKISSSSMVYLTPNGSTNNQTIYVKSKDLTSFTIGIDSTLPADLSINWWIIN